MEDLQKLLPGFPRVTPQAPFLQVTPNVNFMHNVLPRQNLQPTGQLEYKVLPMIPAVLRALPGVRGVCAHTCSLCLSLLGLHKPQELLSLCMIPIGSCRVKLCSSTDAACPCPTSLRDAGDIPEAQRVCLLLVCDLGLWLGRVTVLCVVPGAVPAAAPHPAAAERDGPAGPAGVGRRGQHPAARAAAAQAAPGPLATRHHDASK